VPLRWWKLRAPVRWWRAMAREQLQRPIAPLRRPPLHWAGGRSLSLAAPLAPLWAPSKKGPQKGTPADRRADLTFGARTALTGNIFIGFPGPPAGLRLGLEAIWSIPFGGPKVDGGKKMSGRDGSLCVAGRLIWRRRGFPLRRTSGGDV